MIVMQLNNISKSFGANEILRNIKFEVKANDRIAIVGRNGAGKSTLLKIMAREISYDQGEIYQPANVKIGYLQQHTVIDSNRTIWEEMLSVFKDLQEEEKSLRKLEQKMSNINHTNGEEFEAILKEYDILQEKFQANGGYEYEASIRSVLNGLNFSTLSYDTKINTLSGGQKARLALGKQLLQKPDLLILDEPTNHLDIETLSWLESFLATYPGAIVTVSHDRYFLDKIANIVYEVSQAEIKRYVGTYSDYLIQRQKDYERQLKQYESEQSYLKQTEDFIQRNIARASTSKRAKSRRRQLERMEWTERPLEKESSASFSFTIRKESGNDCLHVKDVSFTHKNMTEPLFQNISFQVTRGKRLALIGPNGVGKTTLLKLITKQLPLQEGEIIHGANVEIGYYDQEQTELNMQKTVLNELWDAYPNVKEAQIRTILGNFLFPGEDVLKKVHSLSGGEKARLSLAKLMLTQANLLILDEPTNHLDIDSKEVLEEALMNYPGTIVFISHDRYFINRIADEVIELNNKHTKLYLGDYDYYYEKKEEEKAILQLEKEKSEKEITQTTANKNQQMSEYHLQKERDRLRRQNERRQQDLENKIETLEKKVIELETKLTEPNVYEDYKKAQKYTQQIDELKIEIEKYMDEWTSLLEKMEQ